jgi:hypothetical protein
MGTCPDIGFLRLLAGRNESCKVNLGRWPFASRRRHASNRATRDTCEGTCNMRACTFIATLALAILAAPRASSAQVVASPNPYVYYPYRYGLVSPTQVFPVYNYYAVLPFSARGYVGYGPNDFPFYGRPYGNPSEPWSWAALSGYNYDVLARYYYPPLR